MPLIAALVVALLAISLSAQELPFKHFRPGDGVRPLPSASVQDILQDRTGTIWLAFFSTGLARYDGNAMESYSIADGLNDLTVRELLEDREGRLWVGSDSGLVVSDRPLSAYGAGERVRFRANAGGKPLIRTRIRQNGLALDATGGIWVATTGDGLLRYRMAGGALDVQQISTSESPDTPMQPVSSVLARRDGSIWAALADGSILAIADASQPRTTRRLTAADGVPAGMTTAMHERRRGTVWGGGTNGAIWRYDERTATFAIVNTQLASRIFSIHESGDGGLWIASLGSGLLRIDDAAHPQRGRIFDARNGLLGATVWSIAQDREGNLWFGQNGGLSRLKHDYRAFAAYTGESRAGQRPALPAGSSFASLPPQPGLTPYLWVATGAGVAAIDAEGRSAVLDKAEGLRSNSIYSLGIDREGRVWAGTSEGLNAIEIEPAPAVRARGDAISVEARETTLFGRRTLVRGFTHDPYPVYSIRRFSLPNGSLKPDDTLWVAGAGGVRCLIGTRWYRFRKAAGISETGATDVQIDESGRLWIATSDRGVFRSRQPLSVASIAAAADPGNGEREITTVMFDPVWNRTHGAPTNSVRNLTVHDGQIWVGTAAGLAILRTEPLTMVDLLTRNDRLGGDAVVGVAYSPFTRSLWISQNRGLVEIDPKSRRPLRRVEKDDGLIENEAWAYGSVSIGADGTIHLATPAGLSLYRPDLDRPNPIPPIVRLSRVDYREDRNGNNELQIRYAALSFANEESVRFRTRLAGYDADWSEIKTDRAIRYTNLPAFFVPRAYRFEVLASNNDGVWTRAPTAVSFRVQPPWWLRWWAVIGYIALFVVSLVSFNRYRTAKLQQHNIELQEIVERRTAEIRQKAMELETLDQIVQAINSEVEFEGVLTSLLEQGQVLFPQAEKGAIILFDHDRQRFVVAAVVGYEPNLFRGIAFTREEAIRRYSVGAAQLQEGVYIIREFHDLPGREQTGHLPTPQSMLAMAITMKDSLEGFLIFDNFSTHDAFDSSDLNKLARLREHAISAIAKARMLRELQAKNREVEQASQAKSMFLANMSHELRTPMNSIIGFSEVLVERLEEQISPRYLNFLRMIHTSGEHLLSIINDILDLSKVEAGKMEIFPERFAIGPVVESVCHIMRGVSAKQEIVFETDLEPNLPPIETDPGKFKQILYNLLSNAVKFSAKGSTVLVVARRRPPANGAEEAVTLSVIDRGIGIAPEHLKLVFEEFRQVDSGSGRQYGGTGLGLALVKKFVEMQGGTVSVESQLGKGSTFSVTFPVHYRGLVTHAPVAAGDPLPAGDRILVIEDDPAAYESIRRCLESAAYVPIRARHGEEGLRLARTVRPIAITLDLNLPDLDGWEVLKRLKSAAETRAIPVIIVSISKNSELGITLGADDYFTKPLDRKLFMDRLKEITATSKRPRLLLIDDDPSVYEILEDELRIQGYEIVRAFSGDEGLKAIEAAAPDVVILDLMMPGFSGFEIADILKSQPSTAHIPILVLTAKDLTQEDRERLHNKIAGIVPKGAYTRTRLISAIRQLGQRHATVVARAEVV